MGMATFNRPTSVMSFIGRAVSELQVQVVAEAVCSGFCSSAKRLGGARKTGHRELSQDVEQRGALASAHEHCLD